MRLIAAKKAADCPDLPGSQDYPRNPNKSHTYVILFPNCKINLGLNIIRKRSDGFHDIETVFYPLAWQDALEIIEDAGHATRNISSIQHPVSSTHHPVSSIQHPVSSTQHPVSSTQHPASSIQFSYSGISINSKPEENLCHKAYQLLKKDFPKLPPHKMHLHKTIPAGAGLGGGSADGAFTLKLLNQKFNLGLSTEKLIDYALQLGSDCPFFIVNKPCFATGRGEFLESIEPDLSACKFVVVNPGIHVSTTEVFSLINPVLPSKSIKTITKQPVESWRKELINDFEEPVFKKYPEIKNIKDQLYQAGAIYASMTGSGSTVYGLFKKNIDIEFSFPSSYLIKNI